MSKQDNSEWLARLLEDEKFYPPKKFHGILSKDSYFLKFLTLFATIFMTLVLLWVLADLDFLPGFSDVAKSLLLKIQQYAQIIKGYAVDIYFYVVKLLDLWWL
jgi:hypothetical protein